MASDSPPTTRLGRVATIQSIVFWTLRALGILAFWLIIWHIIATETQAEVLIASPVQVGRRLVELIPTSAFWASIAFTASRIITGFFLGAILGTALALGASSAPIFATLIDPMVRALRAVPVVSFVLLILLWADSSFLPPIVSLIMVLPVFYANVTAGCGAGDPLLEGMADVFRLSGARRWWAIRLPTMMPYLTAATRSAIGLAWKAGVSAEVIGLTSGSIGERLYQAKLFLATADLFCWTIVIIALAWGFERLMLVGLAGVDTFLARMYSR